MGYGIAPFTGFSRSAGIPAGPPESCRRWVKPCQRQPGDGPLDWRAGSIPRRTRGSSNQRFVEPEVRACSGKFTTTEKLSPDFRIGVWTGQYKCYKSFTYHFHK
jgi:hypothetical protein